MSRIKNWPAAPLIDYVTPISKYTGMGVQGLARARGVDRKRANGMNKDYERARESGTISLNKLDLICIEALGVHPCVVYGMDYFSDEYDNGRRPRKPCRGCGKYEDIAPKSSYCDSCKDKRKLCACGCGLPVSGPRATYASKSHSPIFNLPRKTA